MPDLASRLWNADETVFCTAVASHRCHCSVPHLPSVVHENCMKQQGVLAESLWHAVLGAGLADGARLPPYILYKGMNLFLRWTNCGPAAAMYGVSRSGWMEANNFMTWFVKLFLLTVDHLLYTGPVLLFVDGHYSHVSLPLIRTAKEKGVHLYCLPPHTTHILQPLDVGVYGPIKNTWKKILNEHKMQTRQPQWPRKSFFVSCLCTSLYSCL